MKIKVLILICCICFIGCNKTESKFLRHNVLNKVDETSESKSGEANTKLTSQDKAIVQNFMNSLTEEKYVNAYKEFVLFLWDKKCFIEKNYELNEKNHKIYKQNETFACNTDFVNNELLTDSLIEIGMSKNDVYNLFDIPERSVLKNKIEVIEYSYSMHIMQHNEIEDKFYASTAVDFFLDENEIITKITLMVEVIEEPMESDDWF